MVVPLIYKETVIGVLDLEHTRTDYFNEDHERTLGTLAAQIAIAIENARLYQRVAYQEQRLERDLAMAREVQLRLLPPVRPEHSHAEFAARFLPRAPSAAISTISCDTTPTAAASRLAMSAAKQHRRLSTPRWSAESCVRQPASNSPRRKC